MQPHLAQRHRVKLPAEGNIPQTAGQHQSKFSARRFKPALIALAKWECQCAVLAAGVLAELLVNPFIHHFSNAYIHLTHSLGSCD